MMSTNTFQFECHVDNIITEPHKPNTIHILIPTNNAVAGKKTTTKATNYALVYGHIPMLNGTTVESDSDPPAPRVLAAMTAVLERLVARNEHLNNHSEGENDTLQPPQVLNAFRAARTPSISIGKYLGRIYKYVGCSPACFVVAFAYMDRLLHRHPGFLVVSLNVHRLVLAGVMVASKVLDDVHHDNAFYARVGGVTNAELNALELEMLFQLDFGVMVSSRVFESYCSYMEKEMKWRGLLQKIDRPLSSSIDGEEAQALRRSLILPEA